MMQSPRRDNDGGPERAGLMPAVHDWVNDAIL